MVEPESSPQLGKVYRDWHGTLPKAFLIMFQLQGLSCFLRQLSLLDNQRPGTVSGSSPNTVLAEVSLQC